MNNEVNIFEQFAEDATPAATSGLETNQDSGRGIAYVVDEAEPRALFGAKQPYYSIKHEKPYHRGVIMMSASGMSCKEIAEALEITPTTVQYVIKQPWAAQQILEEIERAGREPVRQLLCNAALEAAESQIELMRNAKSEETKRKIQESIIARAIGPLTQQIEVTTKQASDLSDDELAAIAQKAKTN